MGDHKIQIVDFSNCALSDRHGTYGGQAGLKDGILYNNEYWIIKYPQNTKGMSNVDGLTYMTTPLSEYIGSHIYQILGFDVHETLLGMRNKKIVVGCRDFRADDELLLEVRTIKNAANEALADKLDRDFSETGEHHSVNLEELLIHIRQNDILKAVPNVEDFFWDCVVVDIYINNNDRNNGNWGILRKRNCMDRLAPVFDNGACLSNKMPEAIIEKRLNSSESLQSSALNGITVYRLNAEASPLTARKMLQMEFPELKKAIKRVIPKIIDKQNDIDYMIRMIPEEYLGMQVCSKNRAEFYIRSMRCRLEKLLIPVFKQTMED